LWQHRRHRTKKFGGRHCCVVDDGCCDAPMVLGRADEVIE
jgi:hypothetical protein